MAVVVDQHRGFKPQVRSQRCRLPSFTHLDFSLLETSSIDVAHSLGHILTTTNIPRSFSTPCLTLTTKPSKEELNDISISTSTTTPRVQLIGGQSAPKARALVVEVAIAMASGTNPIPVSSGLGGAYLLSNRNGEKIAVAKPVDEEPLALNNPKGFTGRSLGQPGLKRSVRVGEAGIRELAAYLLDHGGFAGVPPTALVKFSHVEFHLNKLHLLAQQPPPYKIASLQRYVEHDSDAGDLGPSGFSVSSVHHIGILDIRILNIDRHSGNILVGKYEHDKYSLGETELVPIDHGLCLPEWLDDPYFEWLHWPQALVPFSEGEMEYIMNLNPFEDAKLLRTQLPCLSESSIRVLVVCTIFLKRAASAGFCLGDIGEMMTRDCHGGEESMSILESVCARAKDTVFWLHNVEDKLGEEDKSDQELDIVQMFHFDEQVEEDNSKGTNTISQNLPSLWKPPLCPKLQSTKLPKDLPINLNKLEDYTSYDDGAIMMEKCSQVNDNRKAVNLFKSISFAAPGRMNEIEGTSFGEMDEETWEFFLEMFEKFLPEIFDERKNTGITQRVGSA